MSSARSQSGNRFDLLKERMVQSRLTYTDEWLSACYEWLTQEAPPEGVSVDDLQNQVYEQWLEANLEEMESRCLPLNLKDERLKILTGTFTLQVNSVQDVGESAFSQYNKLKKLENENTNVQAKDSTDIPPWQPKPRRALYLTMTDGTQKVFGLEVEPIPKLSLEMKPGCKILVYGPVDCRRGVLHLKPKHVKPMGGEVEAYLNQHSVESTICKILNKPLPSSSSQQSQTQDLPGPFGSQSRPLTALPSTGQPTPSRYPSASSTNTQASFHNRTTQDIGSSFQNRTTQAIGSQNQRTITQSQPQPPPSTDFDDSDDDQLFLDIDETVLIAAASSTTNCLSTQPFSTHATGSGNQTPANSRTTTVKPTSANAQPKSKSNIWLPPLKRNAVLPNTNNTVPRTGHSNSVAPAPTPETTKKSKNAKPKAVLSYLKKQKPASRTNSNSGFNSSDDDLFLLDENNFGTEIAPSSTKPNGKPPVVAPRPTSPELITLDDDDDFIRDTRHPQSTPKTASNRCKLMVLPAAPYQYIKQVKTGQIKMGSTVFVKAIISTMVSNIQVDKTSGEWKLIVNINDGSGFLVARIAAPVLDKIIGFTPSQMKSLKASKVPKEKEKVINGMQQLSKTLVHFSGVMKIMTSANENVILEMRDMTNDHIHDLVTRTSQLPAP